MAEYCRDDFIMTEDTGDSFQMWQGLVGPYFLPNVDESGEISWSNNGGLPNPEPQNIRGPQGEDGPEGPAGPGVPAGGSAGQFLRKTSGTDYDAEWYSPAAGDVSYDSSLTYASGTVGEELSSQRNTLNGLIENFEAPIFIGTVTGTRFVVKSALFPKGKYSIDVANVQSSDTDATKNLVSFYSGGVSGTDVQDLGFNRTTNQHQTFELSQACDTVVFYASTSSTKGTGDTFTFTDVTIKNINLDDKLDDINNQYIYINENVEILGNEFLPRNIADISNLETEDNIGYLWNGATKTSASNYYVTPFYSLDGIKKLLVSNQSANTNPSTLGVFKKNDDSLASINSMTTITDHSSEYYEVPIPDGVKSVSFSLRYKYTSIYDKNYKYTFMAIDATNGESFPVAYIGYSARKKIKSKLFGKKILYFGDSIIQSRFNGYGYDGKGSNSGGIPYMIAKNTGGTYRNDAVGGSTLSNNGATSIYGKVQSAIAEETDINPDLICLDGGVNDYTSNIPLGTFSETLYPSNDDTTTLTGALEKIIIDLKTKWPTKPLVFVIVHRCNITSSLSETWDDYIARIEQICKKYSIPRYNATNNSGLTAKIQALNTAFLNGGYNYVPDGQHPDGNGYRMFYVPQLIKLFESLIPEEPFE